MAANGIIWTISEWNNMWKHEKYTTDRDNIVAALTSIEAFDGQAASPAEVNAINLQLTLPQTPDILTVSLTQRLTALCNAGNDPPLRFRAEMSLRNDNPNEGEAALFLRANTLDGYKDYKQRLWIPFSENGKEIIRRLNALPLANRAAPQFSFRMIFGNNFEGLRWDVAQWMECIIHELGIHVVQMLHHMEIWRNGGHWPSSDRTGELDHYLFRYRGYTRYQLWRNRLNAAQLSAALANVRVWDNKQLEVESEGKKLPKLLYQVTLGGGADQPYDVDDCLALASHFPTSAALFVRDGANPGLVDKVQSAQFLLELKNNLQLIFAIDHNNCVGIQLPLAWW